MPGLAKVIAYCIIYQTKSDQSDAISFFKPDQICISFEESDAISLFDCVNVQPRSNLFEF
jgi:hypothetical protein